MGFRCQHDVGYLGQCRIPATKFFKVFLSNDPGSRFGQWFYFSYCDSHANSTHWPAWHERHLESISKDEYLVTEIMSK